MDSKNSKNALNLGAINEELKKRFKLFSQSLQRKEEFYIPPQKRDNSYEQFCELFKEGANSIPSFLMMDMKFLVIMRLKLGNDLFGERLVNYRNSVSEIKKVNFLKGLYGNHNL